MMDTISKEVVLALYERTINVLAAHTECAMRAC